MTPTPAWAATLEPHQFERFHRLVDSFLRQRGVLRSRDNHGVYDDHALWPTLEVFSLAEHCRTLPAPQWPVYIARTLGDVLAARADFQASEARRDFEQARPLLRVELWPDDVPASRHDEVALRPWLPGLLQGLAMQLEGAAAVVSPQALQDWGVEAEVVFSLALRNVKADGMLKARHHPLRATNADACEGEVVLLIDSSRFMASHAIFISAYASEAIHKGILFVVPHDRMIAMHSIDDATSLHAAIVQLSAFARHAHTSAPRPLTPNLYWWHEGYCHHLPTEYRGDDMVFSPPADFVEQVLMPLDAMTPP